MPYLIGIAGIIVIWLIYRVFSGKWDIMLLAKGEDGLPSSSQFQFLIWTMIVIFSYITIYVARTRMDEFGPISEIPVNLLVLMGISGFSLIASKGISAFQISGGSVAVRKTSPKGNSFKYFIGDENGTPVLNKLQMIAWTFIAAAIYIVIVVKQVNGVALPVLPDVDESLLVLMGISQGTYLGKKLVTTSTPGLKSLTPGTIKAGKEKSLRDLTWAMSSTAVRSI